MSILDLLQLSQVILLGVGAGSNICFRVSLSHPDKVLGLIAVQPVVSAPGMVEQVRGRAVGSDLKANHGNNYINPSIFLLNPTSGKNSDQFLVQHNFGSLEHPSDQLLNLVNKYKDDLHTHINPRYCNKSQKHNLQYNESNKPLRLTNC